MALDAATAARVELVVGEIGQRFPRLQAACDHRNRHFHRHASLDACRRQVDVPSADVSASDERDLLLRAQAGDLAAFEDFVRLFERRIRALLSRFLRDDRDIDEAAQDTFVQAWRHLDRFRGDAAPFTWLYRIAVNEALQRARRKKLDTQTLDDGLAEVLDSAVDPTLSRPVAPDVAAEDHEVQEFLATRLALLPLDFRAPLVLRDLEGWSNQEVADLLDLSVAASKSRIHRARMKIRQDLELWLVERGPS